MGLFFAVWWSGWSLVVDHAGWHRTLRNAVVAAVVFGVLSWLTQRRQWSATSAAIGGMTGTQLREVHRAADTGKPPADPAARRAAIAVLRVRIAEDARHRTFTLAVFAVFAALSVIGLAVDHGLWSVIGTVLFGCTLIWVLRYPRRLSRRLTALEASDTSGSRPPASPKLRRQFRRSGGT